MNKLIIISGPSGVGKGTVIKKLFSKYGTQFRIKESISYTTRPIRSNELNGINYYFISKNEFLTMVKNEDFLEHVTYADNYYGTSQRQIRNLLSQNWNPILEIDVQGENLILNKLSKKNVLTFFLYTKDLKTLSERISKRQQNTKDDANKRLKIAEQEMSIEQMAENYDYKICNESNKVDETVDKIAKILKKYLNK